MSDYKKILAGVLFYMLALVMLVQGASMSWQFLGLVMDNPVNKIMALATTGIGAVAWMFIFLYYANGLGPKVASSIMIIVSLGGELALVTGEMMYGGQTLLEIPPDLGPMLVKMIPALLFAHILAIFAVHLTDSQVLTMIYRQFAIDKITKKALNKNERETDRIANAAAEKINEGLMEGVLYGLGLEETEPGAYERTEQQEKSQNQFSQMVAKAISMFQKDKDDESADSGDGADSPAPDEDAVPNA